MRESNHFGKIVCQSKFNDFKQLKNLGRQKVNLKKVPILVYLPGNINWLTHQNPEQCSPKI